MIRKSAAILSLVLALAGCATQAEYPVLQTGEPLLSSGSLAFLGPDGNLFALLQDESSVLQITDDASPDSLDIRYSGYAWVGERLVYVAQDQPGREEASARFSVATPGERPTQLFSEPGISPFFLYPSPDGSRVGYLGGQRGTGGFVMSSVDVETGERITHGRGQPFYSAWSPDGSRLLTHAGAPTGRTDGSQLTLRDADADGMDKGERLNLATGRFQTPDFSPNGESIAVVLADETDGAGIHLLDREGEDAGRIASIRGAASLGWAPNGSQIAYIDGLVPAGTSLGGPLAVVGGSRREPRLLSRLAVAFFWSPDSTKLLYLEPFQLSEGSNQLGYRVGLYRTFDADSQIIATIRPAPEFVQQFIPFFDQYNRGYSIWAPDSRNVVLNTLASTGERVIILVDTESSINGESFRVRYTPVQEQDESAANLGVVVPDGVSFRPLFYGTVPFFSLQERSYSGSR